VLRVTPDGGGLRVFPESRRKRLFKLAETRTFESGGVVNTYERA
jgi:hypothetical protein